MRLLRCRYTISVTGTIKEPFQHFSKEPLTYDITIDRDSPLSLVRQLSDGLRARILDGRLVAGSKVPSSRDAAENLSVARNVVLEAYEQLEAEGYLEGIAGSGTRVANIAGVDRYPARHAARRTARRLPTSKRADTVVRAPATRAPTIAPRAIDVDFATACGVPEPSAFPVAAWKRCVASSAASVAVDGLAFPDARGHERLRDEISSLVYRSRGIECEPERIFVTRGTTHALSLVARYLRPRSSRGIIEDPMLNSFRRLLARFSFDVECVPVDDAGLRVSSLRGNSPRGNSPRADARGALAVVTPSHQFPSGVILPVSRRLELLDFASSVNGWIFEDDYDGELRLLGVPVPPMLCLDPSRVFYAGTFNKTLYPALRLGYLIVPEREVEPFSAMIRAYAEWPETLASGALAAFIGEGAYERHLRSLRKLYARRRAALTESVERHFGDAYAVKGSEAGCHCRLSPTRAASRRIDRNLALANGVAVAEVAHYIAARSASTRSATAHARDPSDDGAARFRDDLLLGYGNLDEAAIDRGIAKLSDAIG